MIGEANLNTGEVSVSQAPMSSNRSVQFKSIATEGRRNLGMVTRKSCGKTSPACAGFPPAGSFWESILFAVHSHCWIAESCLPRQLASIRRFCFLLLGFATQLHAQVVSLSTTSPSFGEHAIQPEGSQFPYFLG